MGIILATTFATLDGVMQAPGGPDEDRSDGFTHGGWSASYWSDDSGRVVLEQYQRGSAMLLGRRTYEIFAGFWPNQSASDPMAAKLNGMKKYVVSDSLKSAGWHDTTIVRGKDLASQIAKLRAEPDGAETHVVGSSVLMQTLLREDLVDRYVIWTFPVVLGSGRKLFGSGTVPMALRLEKSRAFESGVVVSEYARAGEVRYGTAGEKA